MARMIGFQLQLDPQHWSALFSLDLEQMSRLFLSCLLFQIFITLLGPYPNSSLLNYKQMILPSTKENSKSTGCEGCQDLTLFCLQFQGYPTFPPISRLTFLPALLSFLGWLPLVSFRTSLYRSLPLISLPSHLQSSIVITLSALQPVK